MEISDLLREMDAMISRLVQARGLLSGLEDFNGIRQKRGRPPVSTSIRKAAKHKATKPLVKSPAIQQLSLEERAKIAAKLKARWTKSGSTIPKNVVVSRAIKKTPATKSSSAKKA